MTWEVKIHLLKLQGRLLLICNLLFVFLYAFSEPVIIAPNANVAGSFDLINPSRQPVEYDYLRMGIINRFMSVKMTTFLTQGNKHIKDFNIGGILLFEPNAVLSRLSSGVIFGYSRENISFGTLSLGEIDRYSDGVTQLKGKILLSASVKSEKFFASTSYGFEKDNFIYYISVGFQEKNAKVFIQGAKENLFVLSGGITFAFDESFRMGLLGDTEKRIIYSLEASKIPYIIEYRGMIHTDLDPSNSVFITLFCGNKFYRLRKIRPNSVKPEYGGKIKIKEHLETPLDINKCSYDDLLKLKDVNRQILKKIYVDRLINGNYRDYSRIDSMIGVGKVTLERIKIQTYIGEEDGENEEQ